MTQPAKSQEPSMEEILASIRRIIADDDATKSTPHAEAKPAGSGGRPAAPLRSQAPAPRQPEPNPIEPAALAGINGTGEGSSDILDLTESMATPMPAPRGASPRGNSGAAPSFRTINGESDVGFDEASEKAAPQSSPDLPSNLISRATSAAVDSAFNTLAQTVLVQNARTLEDLVREMLRPMLKTWLDENLPGMVERLVRAEIERVSRGR